MSSPACLEQHIAGAPTSKRLLPNPAFQALILQIVAFPLTAIAAYLFAWAQIAVLPWSMILLVQGSIATVMAACMRAPRWWLLIHFMFPVAVAVAYRWNVSPAVYFVAFIFFLALFWTTFRTRVPFYPSGRGVWDAVLVTLPNGPISVIDLGSGIGGLAMHLAGQREDADVRGIEAAPLPYLLSLIRTIIRRQNCRFQWGRYESIDLGSFDVVFAYLSPAAMPALWEKARGEMRPGAIFYSYEFEVPGMTPQQIISIQGSRARLYRWSM